jgi:hypothetical protein
MLPNGKGKVNFFPKEMLDLLLPGNSYSQGDLPRYQGKFPGPSFRSRSNQKFAVYRWSEIIYKENL